jgi:hypothetical protein
MLVGMRAIRLPRWLVIAALVAAASAAAPGAQAQGAESAAQAEELFRVARQLMSERRWEEAATKLEASQRLDPAVGTLLNLADCHERLGRTASAWAEFVEAAGLAQRGGDEERSRIARDRAAALEPRLVRIVVVVPTPAEGLAVTLDGRPLDGGLLGTPIPVDPAAHRVEATAPGRVRWALELALVDAGTTRTVEIPALALAPAAPPSPSGPAAPGGPVAPPSAGVAPSPASDAYPPPLVAAPSAATRSAPVAGWILGGAGVVVLGVSGGLAWSAERSWTSATERGCTDGVCPSAPAQAAAERAGTAADLATVGLITGATLVGASVTVLLLRRAGGARRSVAGASVSGASRAPTAARWEVRLGPGAVQVGAVFPLEAP